MIKQEIDKIYLAIHDNLTRLWQGIDLVEGEIQLGDTAFRELHDQNWKSHRAALIEAGFITLRPDPEPTEIDKIKTRLTVLEAISQLLE